MIIMCHRKLRTTIYFWNLTELANDVFLIILVWPKWLTGVPSHRSLHPWGQSPCPAGICILSLPWHATQMPSFPCVCECKTLVLRKSILLQSLIFRSQLKCHKTFLWPLRDHPFSFPPIPFMTHMCLYDSNVRVLRSYWRF